MAVRAKFVCYEKTQRLGTGINYVFTPQYDPKLTEEDVTFAKTTPSGRLEIFVDNENVSFEPGKSYYIDMIPVDESVGVQNG